MPTYRDRKLMAEINIVPYIDVMLVLLVIFMVTVPLIQQGIKVDLPQAEARPLDNSEAPNPLIVTVNSQGQILINKGETPNQPLSPDFALRELTVLLFDESPPNRVVYVSGDRGTSYGSVVAAMELLQKAGAVSIGLITEPPENAATQ